MKLQKPTDLVVCPTRLRVHVLGPTNMECWDPHSHTFIPLPQEKLRIKGALQGQTLLELLISQPQRTAHRDWVLEQLWPTTIQRKAEQNLDNMSNHLRVLLCGLAEDGEELFTYVRRLKSIGGTYHLAHYPLIWVDADAFLWYMQHAALYKRMGDDPLPFLETAYDLGTRGEYLLAEPYSDWGRTRREEVAGTFRSCVHQLGHLYLERDCLSEAEFFVHSYWTAHTADEDILRLLMNILGKQERWSEAHNCYQQTCEARTQAGEAIDPRTHDLAEYWRTQPLRPPAKSTPQPSPDPSPVFPFRTALDHLLMPRFPGNTIAQQPDIPFAQPSPLTCFNVNSQSSSRLYLELPEMLMLQRRKFLYDLLNAASSSVITSPYALLSDESRERLERMMAHPSYVDHKAIDTLNSTLQNLWDLRQNIAPLHLLSMAAEHLTTITQLLRDTRPTAITQSLYALASENARLLGAIFDEIYEFELAWKSYAFALQMAQATHDKDLWAVGAVHLAGLIIHWGVPQHALLYLEEAQKRVIYDQRLRVWLSAVEAEIHARAGNSEKFLIVWEPLKSITLPMALTDDTYQTRFNQKMVVGYEAAALLWLNKPERALALLKERNPISIRERSLHLGNLGRAHAQLGDVTKASELLLESLTIITQTKSVLALQRIYRGRTALEPWKDRSEVKELDARIVEVYNGLSKAKAWV